MERSPLKSFVDEPHAAIEGPVQISGRGKSIGTTGHSIPPYPTPPEGWENWPLFGLVDRDHMAEWVPRLWQLIFADNAAEIPWLEALAETTQSQAVDLFIEQSCYDRDLPAFGDGICSRVNAPATPVGASRQICQPAFGVLPMVS